MQMIELIDQVTQARQQFIAAASNLTWEQANFKPVPEAWSISENVEHIVWAEQGGIHGIWKAIAGIKNDKPVWIGEAIHHGLTIEQIIQKTWRPKEIVPENAKPR